MPGNLTFRAVKPWYAEETWLVRGFDYDKNDYRDFQLSKMREIQEIDE